MQSPSPPSQNVPSQEIKSHVYTVTSAYGCRTSNSINSTNFLSIWKARKSSVCRYIQSTTSAPLSMPDGIYIYISVHFLIFIIVIVIFLSSSLSLSFSCLHHCHCHFLVFIIVIPRKICFPPSDESPGAELNEQESIVILRYFICWLWWKMLKNKERLLFLSHILGIILCTFIKHLKWIWKYLFLKMAWNGLNSKLNIIRPNFHLLKDKHFLNDKVKLTNTIQFLQSGSRDHFTG